MATEDIVIRYKADVSQLEQDLDKLATTQQDLLDATKKQTDAVQKSVTTQALAQKKRTQLLELERARLIKLKEASKLAFDPVEIKRYNDQISETTRRIDLLQGKTQEASTNLKTSFNDLRGTIQNVAGAFGVAFSVEAIIQFTKASIDAFLQAEKSAEGLKNAIVSIGGESEGAFNRLIQQSEILQSTTIFGDDDIQAAQQVLSTFGLTTAQIEDLLPKLTDFATVTGTGIVEAANKIGGALQGAGREFKKLGIDVSANNTELQNYQSILQGLDKFSGSAAKATETLAGSFQQLENDANNAQEEIGSAFAEAWLNFKKGAFEGLNALLGFQNATKTKVDAGNIQSINDQLDYAAELERKYGREVIDTTQALEERTAQLEEQQLKAVFNNQQLSKIEKEREESIFGRLYGERFITGATEEQRKINDEIIRSTQVQLDYIKGIADKKKEEEEASKRTLKADELRNKTAKELQDLLDKQKEKYDSIGQSNERLINDELEARKKAEEKIREEAKKTAEARKQLLQQLIAELQQITRAEQTRQITAIDPKSFDESVDKINQLRDLNKSFVDEDIDLKIQQAKAQNLYTKEVAKLFEQIRKGRKDALDVKGGEETLALETATIEKLAKLKEEARRLTVDSAIGDITKRIEEEGQTLQDLTDKIAEGIGIGQNKIYKEQLDQRLILFQKLVDQEKELKIQEVKDQLKFDLQSVKDSTTASAEKQILRQKAQDNIDKINADSEKTFSEAEQNYTDATDKLQGGVLEFVQANAYALQQVGAILGELANLYDQFAEQRIETIEAENEARINAIDEQLAKDQEALDLRRISEEEAYQRKVSLEAQKVKAEEETAKKIREIKRKQAILDKANALFQIALNTAQALADAKNLSSGGLLSGLIITLASLQAAAVIAQPIPYRKGSKDTGASGHMARVGEEGEEIVYMPSHSKVLPAKQTNRYGEVLDAMFDNKLNQYIAKTYVSPALEKQRRSFENQREESFANNITKSLYFNGGLNANDMDRIRKKGQPITNVDEIAKAIASKLPVYDSYRR